MNTGEFGRGKKVMSSVALAFVLSACGSNLYSHKLGDPPYTVLPTPTTPNPEIQKQQDAYETLQSTALGVANSILNDADNPKSRVSRSNDPNNPYELGNYPALQANNGQLIDSTIPQIVLEYRQGQGTVRIFSEDYYYPDNSAPMPQVYKGIELFFSVPYNNSLDTVVQAGQQVQVADFRALLNNSTVVLQSAQQQSGIPYTKDIMEAQGDHTYTISREVADPNTPTTQHTATPAEVSTFNDSLQSLAAQLSQGIH